MGRKHRAPRAMSRYEPQALLLVEQEVSTHAAESKALTRACQARAAAPQAILKREVSIRPLESKPASILRLVVPGIEPEHDDAELVRAFIDGEAWASRAIWSRHAPMVFRLFERAVGPAGDAEDLTQDVFLRSFAGLPALRDASALRSFVYSVALRMLKWELRRRRVRRILRLTPSGELPELPVRAADSEARQLLLRFYALLDELSATERTAFVLRYMEDLKLTEVAELMGVSLATAKRRIGRAARRVSALVEAEPALASYVGKGGFDAPQR